MDETHSFGTFVRRRRKALDLTQAALAQRVGCAESLVRKIEAEERRPSRQVAERLADALALGPEQRALFIEVARGSAGPEGLAAPAGAPPAAGSALRAPGALPAPLTPIVGRAAELAALGGLLAEPTVRLVVIVAPGGMGKTRLALAAAAAQQGAPRFPHGVSFVDLSPLADPDQMAAGIAASLAVPEAGHGPRAAEERLLRALAGRRALLVLDNAEHLPGAGALFAAILGAAPGIALLVTSRERLGLHGEQLFPLGGLATPTEPALVARSDAAALFRQAARRASPLWAPTAGDERAIGAICRLVGGMPLAVELAGAWAPVLPAPAILAELRQGSDLSAPAAQGLPERQRSVRAVLDASWRQLSPGLRAVFARLALFKGGFTREAALAVAGATVADLAALAAAALVQRRADDDRYTLHELLRAYAAERLAEDPEAVDARDAHATFFCAYAAQHAPGLLGPRQVVARLTLEAEQENLAAAWRWAVARRLVGELGRAARALGNFYELRGDPVRGAAAFDDAVARLGEDPGLPPELGAQLLTWRSAFLRTLSEAAEAERLARAALVLLEGTSQRGEAWHVARAHAHTRLAVAVQTLRGVEAREAYEAALAGYRAAGRPWEESFALYHLARLSAELGELGRALELAQASLALRAASGDRRSVAHTLQLLSQVYALMGELSGALARAEECEATFRDLGEEAGLAKGLHQRGAVLFWHGRFAEALALAEQSRVIYEDLGLTREAGVSLALASIACATLGRAGEAANLARAALELHHQPAPPAEGYAALGIALLAQGSPAAAEGTLRASLAAHERVGRALVTPAAPYLALCLLRQGQTGPARALLAATLRLSTQQRAFQPTVLALAVAAPLLLAAGDAAAAGAATAVVWRFPTVGTNALLQDLPVLIGPRRDAEPPGIDELWAAAEAALNALVPAVA